MAAPPTTLPLFGGTSTWQAGAWTSQDDVLRGGASVSRLITAADGTALFCGTLDTTALGGAGFASQRTTEHRVWDLRCCTGVEVVVGGAATAGMVFTLVLKNAVSPPPSLHHTHESRSRKEEASTVSYETTFTAHPHETLYLPFAQLTPTYRGRMDPAAPPLDLAAVRRFSLMVRSFFGTQAGPFELALVSISAVTRGGA